MILFVNVSIFLLPNSFCSEAFATYSFNGCKIFHRIVKHNSMLFEVPKKCSLILVIDVALNSFAQNLHFSSQKLPCFASGVTHATNVHSNALGGGHGIVFFLKIKEQLFKIEDELLKDIFTKQLIIEFCARKLGMLGIVAIQNYNYSMKHIRSGSWRHTM